MQAISLSFGPPIYPESHQEQKYSRYTTLARISLVDKPVQDHAPKQALLVHFHETTSYAVVGWREIFRQIFFEFFD